MAGWISNFIDEAIIVGLSFFRAFRPSNPAPIAIRANGDAIAARLLTVLVIIIGNFISITDTMRPAIIAIIIGFLAMFIKECLILSTLVSNIY